MQHDWILDVLADLQTFAHTNKLTVLAEQLGDIKLVAAAEILSVKERALALPNDQEDYAARAGIRGVRASRRA